MTVHSSTWTIKRHCKVTIRSDNHRPADFSRWCRLSSTVVCLEQCLSVSFVVFLLFFHILLHRLVVGLLRYSPSIFCSVVLLIFSRLDSTRVHFWSVYWLSSITHAQAILIASVCSVGHWYLLSDRFICDAVFIRNPHNSSEPAIFTGIKLILHVFGESPWLTSAFEYWDNT